MEFINTILYCKNTDFNIHIRCQFFPYLAESGVLSVDELLGVLFLSCVEVFRGTLEPNPTGVGRMPRAPFLILLERRTLEPRRPPSSSELSDMLEPWRLGGREPGLDPGVRELRPPWVDWRREQGSSLFPQSTLERTFMPKLLSDFSFI